MKERDALKLLELEELEEQGGSGGGEQDMLTKQMDSPTKEMDSPAISPEQVIIIQDAVPEPSGMEETPGSPARPTQAVPEGHELSTAETAPPESEAPASLSRAKSSGELPDARTTSAPSRFNSTPAQQGNSTPVQQGRNGTPVPKPLNLDLISNSTREELLHATPGYRFSPMVLAASNNPLLPRMWLKGNDTDTTPSSRSQRTQRARIGSQVIAGSQESSLGSLNTFNDMDSDLSILQSAEDGEKPGEEEEKPLEETLTVEDSEKPVETEETLAEVKLPEDESAVDDRPTLLGILQDRELDSQAI